MRIAIRLSPAFLLLALFSCHAAPASGEAPTEASPVTLGSVAMVFARTGSSDAEAVLAAAGPRAAPYLQPLLASENIDLRLRAARLLRDAGQGITLSPDQEVTLLLLDLVRPESHPFSALKALARLDEMGESAVPALEHAAAGDEPPALVARRLLLRMTEEP